MNDVSVFRKFTLGEVNQLPAHEEFYNILNTTTL